MASLLAGSVGITSGQANGANSSQQEFLTFAEMKNRNSQIKYRLEEEINRNSMGITPYQNIDRNQDDSSFVIIPYKNLPDQPTT